MDFNVRSDSIDVEQIMEQIRSRIREKRGVDYTEQQLRELAAVKLEKFLDPRGVRSDLLEQFRQHQPRYDPPIVTSFSFEDTTMFETHRGALRFIRKLLSPILKLFFNPNALIHALHAQSEINKQSLDREVTRENQRRDMDALYFEVIHNLVFELTRTGIEVKNLKMRVESLASRLEFSERRARALESVVVYRPSGDDREEPAAPRAAKRAASQKRREQSAAAGRDTGPPACSVAAGRTTRRKRGRQHGPGRHAFAGDRRRSRNSGPTKPQAAAAAWAAQRRPGVRPDEPIAGSGTWGWTPSRPRRREPTTRLRGWKIARALNPSTMNREANSSRPSLDHRRNGRAMSRLARSLPRPRTRSAVR